MQLWKCWTSSASAQSVGEASSTIPIQRQVELPLARLATQPTVPSTSDKKIVEWS